jgi:hypothetical protein
MDIVTPTNLTTFIGFAILIGGLLLVLRNNENDLGKIAHGEIRKIITIVFTAIYIVLLPYYFFDIYVPNATNITIMNLTSQNSELLTFNLTANSVPALAVTDMLKNFLYVYIFIIVFYFTSRSIDGYSDAKKTEALKSNSPTEIAEMRYARGKIDDKDLAKIKSNLDTSELIRQIKSLREISPSTDTDKIAKTFGRTKEEIEKLMEENKIK